MSSTPGASKSSRSTKSSGATSSRKKSTGGKKKEIIKDAATIKKEKLQHEFQYATDDAKNMRMEIRQTRMDIDNETRLLNDFQQQTVSNDRERRDDEEEKRSRRGQTWHNTSILYFVCIHSLLCSFVHCFIDFAHSFICFYSHSLLLFLFFLHFSPISFSSS